MAGVITGLKQSSTTAVGHTSHANYNSWLSTLWFLLLSVWYRESVKVPKGNWKLYSQKTVTNRINMENTKTTRRWEEEFERVHIQLPKPLLKRIRIVLGMLVSRQSMICCNSSCIPGVWNRSSYQRGYNEWNNAKWPALRFWWLPRDQESSRKWGEGRGTIHDIISIICVKFSFKLGDFCQRFQPAPDRVGDWITSRGHQAFPLPGSWQVQKVESKQGTISKYRHTDY